VRGLLRLWFHLDVPVSRRAYALSGFGLMAFKYAVEAIAVHEIAGPWLSPLDYLNPLLSVRQAALRDADWLLWPIAAWTLPFLWVGVSMTLRRLEDARLSPALTFLYFVPGLNYLLMLALCVVRGRRSEEAPPPGLPITLAAARSHRLRSAMTGILLGVSIALTMVVVSVLVFGAYGTSLFAATPFVMGATSAFVFNRAVPRGTGETMVVAELAVLMAGGAIVLFALEGLLCLAMAAPIGLAMAAMGALLGQWLAIRRTPLVPRSAALVLLLPALSGLDTAQSREIIEVVSHVDIAAPPERVWANVIAFSDLSEPPPLLFRLGIAYPRRARISGRGPGAMRRCEFSTGPFLEPITTWDEPRRLAFDVAGQPPPMDEWSPYRHVLARHLDGYLRVERGEFRLEPLPGGGTRLSGSTWYEIEMGPRAYWALWSNALLHSIHAQVLGHIKQLSEN
jgi:hypothetical protein